MKKILIISIILLLLCINIPNSSGKNPSINPIESSSVFDSTIGNIAFNLKMRSLMRIGQLNSISACIVKNNTIQWSKGYGFSDNFLLQRPTKDRIYLSGSITKVVTATAIMQLYENDSYDFDLDDNVSKWLPFDLKNPNYPKTNISFRMLLSHQSSLIDSKTSVPELASNLPYSYVEEMIVPGYERYNPEYWAKYPPGQDANYSNLGFIILGLIIENMTKMSYEQYCQDKILNPLEMNNSSFNLNNLNKYDVAPPYYLYRGRFIRGQKFDHAFLDPCGGLFSTSEDLSHLLIAHLNDGVYDNKRILEKQTIDLMHIDHYPNSSLINGHRYGLGWSIFLDDKGDPEIMGHGGFFLPYLSRMYYNVTNNVSIIYFFNSAYRKVTNVPIFIRIIKGSAYDRIEKLLFEKAEII